MIRGLLRRYGEHTRGLVPVGNPDLDAYKAKIRALIREGDRVLHIGCGWDRSRVTTELPASCTCIGVDQDSEAGARYPREFVHTDGTRLPFDDASFDAAICEYVFEHVVDPDALLSETARVLRDGGVLIALTPNAWSYKSLAARATPHWFHRLAARRLRPDARSAEDVYPTAYRMNTREALERLASRHRLRVEALEYLNNGPTWFRSMPGVFELGVAYHRLLDRAPALDPLRCGILVTFRREAR